MQEQPRTLLECPLKLKGYHGQDQEILALLSDMTLELRPKYGDPLTYSYRDIAEIQAGDYQVTLTIHGGEDLHLYHLGSKYSDFVRILMYQRNEQIIADMLMREEVHKSGVCGDCSVHENDNHKQLGPCEFRLCDTALLIIPQQHGPIRVPYSFIADVHEDNYTLTINSELGDAYTLSRMGREFQPFTGLLSDLVNGLSAKAQALLREIAPAASPSAIHQAARLLREGRAAKQGDLEQIDPAIAKGLEQQLVSFGIEHEYDFLSSLAEENQQYIGFKRELVAVNSSEYIWFLIPIPKSNVIAMEASSGPDSGRATYFFRIVPRAESADLEPEQVQEKADRWVMEISYCMLAINFRREPIYLPEEKLDEPRYNKYLHSVRIIPGLVDLRQHFVGRVFHRDTEQWENDVRELLRFNVSIDDDSKKWAKGDVETSDAHEASEEGG